MPLQQQDMPQVVLGLEEQVQVVHNVTTMKVTSTIYQDAFLKKIQMLQVLILVN